MNIRSFHLSEFIQSKSPDILFNFSWARGQYHAISFIGGYYLKILVYKVFRILKIL